MWVRKPPTFGERHSNGAGGTIFRARIDPEIAGDHTNQNEKTLQYVGHRVVYSEMQCMSSRERTSVLNFTSPA